MTEEIPKKTEESKATISRREFLKDAGLIVGGATVGSMALINACGTPTVTAPGSTITKTVISTAPGGVTTVTATVPVGSGVVTTTVPGPTVTKTVDTSSAGPFVKLKVNKLNYEVKVEPNWSLRYLLHDKMGFISAKDMCAGHGECGSCTVVMDGRPVLSCMTLAVECDGKTIETSEGIYEAGHPIFDAYLKYNCMQCGYCTPGFITTAKALLDKNPSPTEQDVAQALGGNLCRCGTYPAHLKAVLEAAAKVRGG